MDSKEDYIQDGFLKGFNDAKRTDGNIKQENIDKYLSGETKNFSPTFTRAFIEGWYAGFNDGVEEIKLKVLKKNTFGENYIFWKNPKFKDNKKL